MLINRSLIKHAYGMRFQERGEMNKKAKKVKDLMDNFSFCLNNLVLVSYIYISY